MNTANLQLEGLYMAVAALAGLMRSKNIATADEIDAALAGAERAALDGRADLPPANIEAIGFPIRLLRLANGAPAASELASFRALARRIGADKDARVTLDEDEMLKLASTLEHERDA